MVLAQLRGKPAKKMMETKRRHKRDVMSQINLHLFRIILLNWTENQLQHSSFSGKRCFIFIWRLLFIYLLWDKIWVTFAFRLGNSLECRIFMHWYDEFVFISSREWVKKLTIEIWMNFLFAINMYNFLMMILLIRFLHFHFAYLHLNFS